MYFQPRKGAQLADLTLRFTETVQQQGSGPLAAGFEETRSVAP